MSKSTKSKDEDKSEILSGPPSERPKRKRGRPLKGLPPRIPDTPENVAKAVVSVPRDRVPRPE